MSAHPYVALVPDRILDAIEAAGFHVSGRLAALNSYENRVYQVGLESGDFIVAKFYRPGRWSDAALLEEHHFSLELAQAEIPVVAPLSNASGATLHQFEGFRFALFPRVGGHAPELGELETLYRIGQTLGRLHAVGSAGKFTERGSIDIERMGVEAVRFLQDNDFIPGKLRNDYRKVSGDLIDKVRAGFKRAGRYNPIRLHGDLHPGNILWRERKPLLVDLDDSRMGPAVQDLWMLLQDGESHEVVAQLAELVDGYQEFHDFDLRQLHLVEPLRALRQLDYCAWLARRWDDPAFPQHFPWFNSGDYWLDQLKALREQLERIDREPPNLGQQF